MKNIDYFIERLKSWKQEKYTDLKSLYEEFYSEFKSSKNKLYTIVRYKNFISGNFAFITLIFGVIGFKINGLNWINSFLKTIGLFGLNFPSKSNIFILFASISALVTVFLLAVLFFLRDVLNRGYVKKVISNDHTVLFGLGEINRSYLDSLFVEESGKTENLVSKTLIVESNSNSRYIDEYRQKGFVVLVGDALSDIVQAKLNYENMSNAIIALGYDRHNIEFSKQIMAKYSAKSAIKLVIHIQNKDLEILFNTSIIEENKKINIKTFSFYEEVAKTLFRSHFIDGDTNEYINTKKEFTSIVLGDNELVEKILFQIALISHLPYENQHTVYLINKNASNLFKRIRKKLYYKKEENSFPNLKIIPYNLDHDTLEFFEDSLWNKDNLVNIIVAFDEEKQNLDLAVELYNRIYLENAINKSYMPKILVGIYNEMLLSQIINENNEEFNNFYTFGNINNILSYSKLIDEDLDLLGKLINYNYEGFLEGKNDGYNKYKLINYKQQREEYIRSLNSDQNDTKNSIGELNTYQKVNEKWYNRAELHNKLSSISQAEMIDIKLKVVGLKRKKSNIKNIDKLLKKNRKIFDKHLELKEEFNGKFIFPKEFESDIFRRLIRMEHNRWNAYHFLHGWKYSEIKNKSIKKHDCLISLEKFKKEENQDTIVHDIYSFMYIPNYLAEVGDEIIEHIKEENNKRDRE